MMEGLDFRAVLIGLLSGMLAGAFGVGGGIIATPLTRILLGTTAQVAVGTTLAMILPTAISGIINYVKEGKISGKLALATAPASMLGSIGASALSDRVSGSVLMLALSALMIIAGSDFIFGLGARLKKSAPETESPFPSRSTDIFLATLIGFLVGALSGFLGVGGGFIMIPAFCAVFNMSVKAAFGTSLLVIAAVSLPGTIVHFMENHVRLDLVALMLLGSVPGAWLGSKLSLKAKDTVLKKTFGYILCTMAVFFAYREILPLLAK